MSKQKSSGNQPKISANQPKKSSNQPKSSANQQTEIKQTSETKDIEVPILKDENYYEWHSKMQEKLKNLKLYHFVEYGWKLKDIKPEESKFYKTSCEKVINLLLSTTEKADQELIKLKTDQNIATAWNEICKKYEGNRAERVTKMLNNLFTLDSNTDSSGEELAKRYILWSKKLVKSVDDVGELVLILIMSKLQSKDLDPNKLKSMEEHFKTKLDKITLEILEKTILEINRSKNDKSLDLDANESSSDSKEMKKKSDKKKTKSLQAIKSGIIINSKSGFSSDSSISSSGLESNDESPKQMLKTD